MPHSPAELWTDSPRFRAMCEAVLAAGSRVRFHVRGMSMQPNLLDGDKVVVVPAAVKDLRKGEIVLAQSEDGLRVHRIVAVETSSRVVTRGDAGQENDLKTQEVIGRVIEIERDGQRTWKSRRGQRYLDASRTFVRRLKLAVVLRLKKLGSGAAIIGLALVLGILLNAAPAAAQTADLQLTQTASAPAVAAGSNYTYTEVVTNNNSSATVTTGTITVYMQTPANTTFQAFGGTNWTCTTPTVGNPGPVVCTYNTTLASGATASSLTVTFQVAAGTAAGTTIQGSATVTNSTFVDPAPSNNTSITSIIVEPAASADLSISMSVSPTPVFVSSSLVYNITVQNLGQASAAVNSNVLQDILPSGANGVTFSGIIVPSGWSCTTPAVGSSGTVQCSITTAMPAAPAAGSTVSFAITVNSPTNPTTLSNTATVSLPGDPNSANNSATSYTVVQPIACATPGKDGAGGALTGIVNAYYPPSATGILAAGSTSVTVGAAAGAPAAQTQISSGDLLLIIQMQGTAINNSNASTYGHGVPGDPGAGSTNIGNSGLFEFVTATNAAPVPVTGGTVQFTGTGPTGGLLNTYTNQRATNSTSLGAATAASWANGIVSFTFPTPLPARIVPNAVLTTTGFTPAGYNLTEAPILSVNTATGVVTAPLATNPGAETALGTGSFTVLGQQTYQVIRVPQYTSATLSSGLVPLAWNGGTVKNLGGVLAIDVSSQLTLGGTVALDALGFRGGGGITLRGAATAGDLDTDYVTSSPAALPVIGAQDAPPGSGANASKGEGIAGTPHWVAPVLSSITTSSTAVSTGQTVVEGYIGGSFARGAPGNGGGGGTDGDPVGNPVNTGVGNDQNSGGGAGGNGGTGGQGGYGWNSIAATNSTDGGFGGVAFPASTSALVMGGGGGSGTTNNGSYYISNANNNADCGTTCTGIYSSGGYGGGIAIIHVGSATGTGSITSNGQSTLSTDKDSTGGAGAGGSILVFANSGGLSGLTVSATGGNGGNAWQIQPPGGFPGDRHGPGGGGGGGVVFLTGTPASSSVVGGSNGYTDTVQDSYGATPGQNGVLVTTNIITETPGTQSGAYCASADLSVTNSGSPAVVVAGSNITYTQGVTNNGPMAAVNAVFSEAIPANTTFQSLTVPSGWTCTTPAVGGTGNINCTNPLVNNAASASFTLVVQVNAGTTNQTQITDVASVTSGTNDPNLTNNSARVTTIVGAANSANLAVTNTASPNPVQAGNNITYAQKVTNNGPSAAANVTFTETLPANTTFFSMTTPAGWSCTDPPVGNAGTITCTIASLAAGSSASFNPVLTVAAGTVSGTQITDTASVSSTTPEPNPTSNSASATVVVASSGQADLSVAASASPNPVLAGGNITITQSVTNNGPGAAATDTFKETIPATASFISLTVPPGWACITPAVGSSGNINCAATTDASGTVSNFPLVIKALQSDTPGTTISITATAGSATSDPIPGNNSATASTVVTSPSQADVAIIKTASPEPVDKGTNLAYTLQITNNGPAVAQGVTVTDNIPTSDVSYVSSSSTQGTCTTNTISQTTPYPSTLQISCNIGSISVGGLVLVTINVTANTNPTQSTNTASVSATTGDPNLTNNSSTAISTIQSPTAVQLVSFRALSQAGGAVILEWKTREEVRNLGFNVYREDAAGRHRLNASLIAGAALILRGSQPQHGAKTYRWIDPRPSPGAIYWLEDVDLGGTRVTHGPAELVESAQLSTAGITLAPLLTQANKLATVAHSAGSTSAPQSKLAEFQRPATLPDASVQPVNLDNDIAIQISVQHEGWYRITRAQLVAAGLNPYANARTLQLFAEGIEQPLLILGNHSGPLGPNDAIEFYGTGIDTPYSGTRVYWLVWGRQNGLRIPVAPTGSGGAQVQAFPATAVHEDRTTYFAALINSEDQDNFFGAIITSAPTDQELDVVHSAVSNLPITMDVTLQGVTEAQDHSVSVVFNGVSLGNINFSNQANYKSTFTLDPTLVQDGANTVTLTALDGDNDVSLVQSIVLHYAHSFTADNDLLRMQVAPGSQIHATGFSNAHVRIFDVTNPLAIEQLAAAVQTDAFGFALDFVAPGSSSGTQPRLLFAVADDQLSSPSALTHHERSNLQNWREGAIEVIITHPDFAANLAPLVRLREEQGISVKLVTIDEIFDAYNYGERSPYAVRTFLQHAMLQWHIRPQFVLFAGRASVDPRNYLGFGDLDFVPTRLIDTAALKTASDDWFTDFHQTGFATLATGRLPVTTPADADLLVSKIVGYEHGLGSGSWNQQALIVADQNIGANFSGTANSIASTFAKSLIVTKILGDQVDPQTAKQQILGAINAGKALVNYTGHGSVEQWSFSDLLDDSDAAALQNGDKLPVFFLMDCLNGFFHDVYTVSLAQSLLLSPNGGAVAVWASSGFTDAGPQAGMDLNLTSLLASSPKLALGKAILAAKATVTDPDVRRTWILFGDPAMRIQFAVPAQAPGVHLPPARDPRQPIATY